MKAIQTGNTFRIYDDTMKTYEQLPPQAYLVNFNQMGGFYLTTYSDIELNEKVYGVHESKVKKVFNAFTKFNRNLGVILSGDKGIGKSLFSKMLSKTAIDHGFPLIIVNSYIPGIGEYLNSIEQQIVVLFDEFDKIFKVRDDHDPQAEMLTLFDGIAQGKKLFIVTCNGLHGLNDFLVNRPGRFHYHFRFEYPTGAEITEYLQDNLDQQYWREINNVVSFAKKVDLNYDCLRSIAFELNAGEKFEDAIRDLNILHITGEKYTLTLLLDNGEKLRLKDKNLDLFSEDEKKFEFHTPVQEYDIAYLTFIPADNVFDHLTGRLVIKADNLHWDVHKYLDSNDEIEQQLWKHYKDTRPVQLIFTRTSSKDIHYAL